MFCFTLLCYHGVAPRAGAWIETIFSFLRWLKSAVAPRAIKSALIAALQSDPTLPEYALKHRVALLSPANFLATVRTVASVWRVQKQNTNAQDIARRATQLDAGLVEKAIGDVLEEDGHLRLVKEGDED